MKKILTFLWITAVAGVFSTLAPAKKAVDYSAKHLAGRAVIQVVGDEIIEYPSLEDAEIISGVPQSVIIESIITEQPVEGYVFSHK